MTLAPQEALRAGVSTFDSFAHQWDPLGDRVLLVRLSPDECRAAAFLDQRVLNASTVGAWFGWADFARAAASLPHRTPPMIFHVGHCGSTLISRLIEFATGAQGLREPLILRALASELVDAYGGDSIFSPAELESRLDIFLRSIAREEGRAVVKASSMCGPLAEPIFRRDAKARGAFVFVRPHVYIATMLGGENNQTDLYGFAKFRRRRLIAAGADAPPLSSLSDGEIAGLCWLAEAAAFAAAAGGERFFSVDFDDFLKAPSDHLAKICMHFGVSADKSRIDAAIGGPIMRTYSKAQEFPFDPAFRARVLADYERDFSSEIAKGAALIDRLAKSCPAAARGLSALG